MEPRSNPPAWGALPVEQYLIRQWNHESPLAPAEQRQQLVGRFLALDEIPTAWNSVLPRWRAETGGAAPSLDREPTPGEVELILRPWRSQDVRRAAASLMEVPPDLFCPVFLLTHYDHEGETVEVLIKDVELYPSEGHWRDWLADDRDLFGSLEGTADGVLAGALANLPEICALTRELIPYTDTRGEQRDRHRFELREQVTNAASPLSAAEVAAASFKLRELQELAVYRTLAILDKTARETEKFLWVYLDTWGNVVRAMRIGPGDLQGLSGAWEGHANLVDHPNWDDCENEDNYSGPGDKYTLRGELGRKLYGVEDLLGAE